MLDKTHPAHIRREIVDIAGAFGGFFAVFLEFQIDGKAFNAVKTLVLPIKRLHVDRPDPSITMGAKGPDEVSAYESARPRDQDQALMIVHPNASSQNCRRNM